MITMTTINDDLRFARIDEAFDNLDIQRVKGLKTLQTIQTIKNKALQKEQQRLSVKYGSTHPKVLKVSQRVAYNKGLIDNLDTEIKKATIKISELDKNTWLVHGKVFDKNGSSIKDVTVSIYDGQGEWLEELGHSCSDGNGYFSLRYSQEFQQLDFPNTPLFLTITNSNAKVIHKEDSPVYVSLGQVDYREIVLEEADSNCTPPNQMKDLLDRASNTIDEK